MKFFSILSRYLTRQFLANFFMVFFAILGIILLFDSIESLRRVSGREDIGFWFTAQYAVTRITKTVEIVIPFVVMVSAMITFWRLSKNNEFVIIRTAGVSIFSFLRPLIIAAFCLGIANITLLNPIAAKMYEWHEVLSYRLVSRNPNAMLFSSRGLWIREAVEDGKVLLIQAKTLRQEKDNLLWMRDISITELNSSSQITQAYEAYFATLEGNVFHLKDVKHIVGGKPVENMSDYVYKTNIDMQRIKENFIEPDAISFWQLPDTISFYESAGFSARLHWMRYLNLLLSPFLLVGMLMMAAVFMLQNTLRGSAIMWRVVISIATGFSIYFLSQVVYAFGVNGYIPIWLAVSAPTIIILLMTTSLLVRTDEV
ncbi:MAG: LptF/LptG family permease [Alphaproteobacteria bacterium]|nr:LptF/LptG family permease [Alphaproteobacteria bacterium]